MSRTHSIELIPYRSEYLLEAANLFAARFKQQRRVVPSLPYRMEDPKVVSDYLKSIFARCPGLLALENNRLVGFMGWYIVDHFRETERRAAYLPVWAHAVKEGREEDIYRALYREAGEIWTDEGCDVHAITLLANDDAGREVWFWNGFGMAVVDAIRTIQPLNLPLPQGLRIFKATITEVDALSEIEAEHWQHYLQSPLFMRPPAPNTPLEFANLIQQPGGSAWLAMDGDQTVGYLRFEARIFGATVVVESPTTIAINGAYVRPTYRGRKVAAALLDAALKDYQQQGYERCSVDFESFNPEAAAFWPRFFQPVCFSLMRVPEYVKKRVG